MSYIVQSHEHRLYIFSQTIEILPGDGSIWMQTRDTDNTESEPSFFPFLFVEENLGVPQKILYKVYLHAIAIFKSARSCIPTRPTISIQDSRDLDASALRALAASSSVLLLANPSHHTALNARKHLVRMHLIDPHTELRFMASLQSSQHCAKHAELWYHRRWLLSAVHDPQFSDTAKLVATCCRLRFASQEVLQRELTLVSRACELYPRNYFAWTHWQICVQSLLSDYLSGDDTVGFVLIFRREMAGLKEWIDHHVSDYSAIHSILTLSQVSLQCGDVVLGNLVVEEDIVDHAISLVQAYPAHEALWMYARAALSMLGSWQTEQAEQFMHSFVRPLACSQLNTSSRDDLDKALQFAQVFLDKRAS